MRILSISPRLLLPLIMLMGILIIGMRVEDIWNSAAEGRLFSRDALAQAAPEKPAAAPSVQAPPAEPQKMSEDKGLPTPAAAPPAPEEDLSSGDIEVLKQLTARRGELDKRSNDLDTREALIKVAEQRVDSKIKEMENLRQQLQAMVNQVNETQAVQYENLVKIYETMKPDEAARIFETLEMPTLLGVVERMKPKSTAPIMAKMAPDKAKELTMALTKQDQLPVIK